MKKLFKRLTSDPGMWVLLTLVFWATRLIRLNLIPIFTDEAIYLRWSQIMSGDWHYIYLPLTDGKPPLFMWVTALAMKVFPSVDPLLVGRIVSAGAGYLALIGIFFTAYQLFKRKDVAYLSAIFYLASPFTFFYDRFALADAMLAMFGVWSLGLGIVLVRNISLNLAILLGTVIGWGLLTKTPAQFFWVLLPVLVLFFDFRQKERVKKFVKLIACFVLVAFIARAWYMLLYFLPQAYVINLKSYEFIVPLSEFLKAPFRFFVGNARALGEWEIAYLTWPVVVAIVYATITGLKQRSVAKLTLLAYFFSLFIFMSLLNKVIYPRFLLEFTPMLLILAAAGLADLRNITKSISIRAIVMIAVLLLPVYTDYKLLTDPPHAPIADNDSQQYINGQPAGYGVVEVNSFITQEAKKYPKIVIGTEGTFGLMPYGLELYQSKADNVTIRPYWPAPAKLPAEIVSAAKVHPTYYVIYQRAGYPPEWEMELVAAYRQGISNSYLKLYKVLPNN